MWSGALSGKLTFGEERRCRVKAIVQINISHSNSIDLNALLEKIKIAAEELTEDYMQGAGRYKNRAIDIEIESFTRVPIN